MSRHDDTLEAEAAVLGAVLVDPEAARVALGIINGPGDFIDTRHATVWRSLERLAGRGEPVDLITVTRELSEGGKIKEAGGAGFVSALLDALPDVANVDHHARLVVRDARDRRVLAELRLATQAAEDGKHAEDIIPRLMARCEGRTEQANPWDTTGGVSWADDRLIEVVKPKTLIGPMVDPSWLHLYSAAGGGKTLISLALGLHAAAGIGLLGWDVPRPVEVVYLDGELGMNLVRQRVHDIIRGHGLDEDLIAKNFWVEGFDRQGTPLPALGDRRFRDVRLKYPTAGLLIVDNVRTLTGLDFSENDVEAWAPINDNLKHLRADGLSIITNHHGNRAGGFNGSAAQGTLADLLIKVKRHNGDGARFPIISFESEKNRHGVEIPDERWELYEPGSGGLAWGSGGPSYVPDDAVGESEDSYQARIVLAVESKPGLGKSKLFNSVGGKRERFNASVEAMVFQGIIHRETDGYRHRYTLPNSCLNSSPTSTPGNELGNEFENSCPPSAPLTGHESGNKKSSTVPLVPAPFRESGRGTSGEPSDVPTEKETEDYEYF